ncbi:XRE family transcriptional regulator [Adhaeribacter radiodurans]|uniref:LexA family transcriptional regulator n=1 Tax=Adhaeribacter radiodurans TaxID=2745197 RepID=A0A7L7L6V5_9BACT|nr:XRE family transcriptional regulator [Adhaeribacter radiodurans]QMU28484.1 LexA family transcriptional regulator [Adhaeribacter radiodurans]
MINTNLKFLRKQTGLTQSQLAEKLNIKRSLIGAYEEGRAEPKLSTLVNISKLFNISLDILITKDLPSSSTESSSMAVQRSSKGNLRVLAITVDREDKENIELVPQRASAGYLNGYADPEFIEELPRFRLPMLSTQGTHRAFEIAGDSMLPIASGAVIIGRFIEDWSTIKDGTPCIIVSQKEGVVFKRIFNKLKNEAVLYLHSDNPSYSPYQIQVEDILEIWEARAYISTTFPIADLSLNKLTSIVLDLQQEVLKLKKA